MTNRQIVLLQPHLASLDGHEHTQIKALEWLLPQHRLTVVTRQGCTLADQYDQRQLLQLLPSKQHKSRFHRLFLANTEDPASFHSAIEHAFSITRVSPSDLFLVPSAGPEEIAAMVDFMEHRESAPIPPARMRILSEDVVSRLDNPMRDRVRRLSDRGCIALYTETGELCRRIQEQHCLPVQGALYMPCTILPGGVSADLDKRLVTDEVRVGVLGRQRSEKGSYRMPAILSHLRLLASRNARDQKICIVYQAVRSKRFRRFALEARTRLGARQNPRIRVEFLNGAMDGSAFRQVLQNVDVLMLPYDTRRYRYSGSGIIMDAIVARKPIVYSKGMAMAALMKHGNAETAETDREFAEKLLEVATHLPRYQRGTRDALAELKKHFAESARVLAGDRTNAAS